MEIVLTNENQLTRLLQNSCVIDGIKFRHTLTDDELCNAVKGIFIPQYARYPKSWVVQHPVFDHLDKNGANIDRATISECIEPRDGHDKGLMEFEAKAPGNPISNSVRGIFLYKIRRMPDYWACAMAIKGHFLYPDRHPIFRAFWLANQTRRYLYEHSDSENVLAKHKEVYDQWQKNAGNLNDNECRKLGLVDMSRKPNPFNDGINIAERRRIH